RPWSPVAACPEAPHSPLMQPTLAAFPAPSSAGRQAQKDAVLLARQPIPPADNQAIWPPGWSDEPIAPPASAYLALLTTPAIPASRSASRAIPAAPGVLPSSATPPTPLVARLETTRRSE